MDNDELARALGQYVRTRRVQLGLTQRQVKEHLGFSAQFLGRIEKGQAMVPEEALITLINVLGLDRAELENIFIGANKRHIAQLFQKAQQKSSGGVSSNSGEGTLSTGLGDPRSFLVDNQLQ